MTGLSLFTGIGGMDLAFEAAGGCVVGMCEQDKFCQKVLRKHWPSVPIFDDVCELRGEQIGAVDVIFGGFPCQPFSTVGKRLAQKDDRHLWPHFMRLIREIRPTWIVGENVDGIIRLALDDVLQDLENEGYSTRAFNIPAGAVGAVHRRYRVFMVAHAPCQRFNRRSQDENRRDFNRLATDFTEWQILWGEAEVRIISQVQHTETASEDLRIDYGFPDWTHRIRALGNAVVPSQIYPIFKAIKCLEAGKSYS